VSRVVVKVGGAVAGASVAQLLELSSGNELCVVHGAGPQISAEMERAGIEVQRVRGLRVTTPEVLEIVRDAFRRVNASLCAALGERAEGFFGDEIGFEAVCWASDLGLVGEADPQELPALERALGEGKIAVVAPLAVDADRPGVVLNVNADDAAAAIAVGMQAERLLFLTDVEGFMLGGDVVDSLDVPTAERLSAGGSLDPTILPKLDAAIKAARFGVPAFIGRTKVEPVEQAPGVPLRRVSTR
jgi:acetylglutamate kinase